MVVVGGARVMVDAREDLGLAVVAHGGMDRLSGLRR